jgi:hypothetical protein
LLVLLFALIQLMPIAFGQRNLGKTAAASQAQAWTGADGVVNGAINAPAGGTCMYVIAQIGGAIVPGTVDTGNHGDDQVVTIALPFSYTLYDQTFASINLSSNGNAQFTTLDTAFTNSCLPWLAHNYTIFPYWDDLYLVNAGFGIFTSVSGTAPNRIFNIEWRAQYFPGSGTANFELRLYEGQSRFDIIYGTLTNGNTSATAGVQQNDTNFQQYFCNGAGGAATGGQSYTLSPCGTSCTFRVLIAYADIGGPPSTLQSQILAESGVTAVDLFDAFSGTPTLAQLQQYNIVVAFSDNAYNDAVAMGNVLADYADTGGIVVGLNFDWYGPPFGLGGRWMTGGYTPFNSPAPTNFTSSCLGTYNMAHPLMQNISPGSLCAFFRHTLTLSAGAVSVAMYQDNQQLCAYKTNNGHTGVGINAYLGENPMNFSGLFGRVIVNAGRWLGCASCNPAWQNEPPMGTARRNAATIPNDGGLYAITGFDANPNYTTANERFDGTTWTARAPIPVRHAQSRGASVGTKIYVPGGFNSVDFSGPINNMQIYDTVADSWTQGMVLPAARSGVATAAFNGLIYVISGYATGFVPTTTVYIYDPVANSYTTGAPMPVGQGNVPGVLLNGEIYVVGGGTAPGAQFAYNPSTNMWRTIAPLPTTNGLCQSGNGFGLGGKLWITGCLGLPINQQVWTYDPVSDTWTPGAQYNVDHQGPGATLFNGRGFVVGGGAAVGGSTAVESIGLCGPTAVSAVSRINHGSCGTFDVPMPLTCPTGVECRSQSGNAGNYTLVVTFDSTITAVVSASVTCHNPGSGTGTAGAPTFSGNTVTVPLTGVSDGQALTVHITATSASGTNSVDVPFGLLLGDTNANRAVTGSDIAQTKAQSGMVVTAANFREDVNANCAITGSDISFVKSRSGVNALPNCCP